MLAWPAANDRLAVLDVDLRDRAVVLGLAIALFVPASWVGDTNANNVPLYVAYLFFPVCTAVAVLRLRDVLDAVRDASLEHGREIGVVLEIKHATYFRTCFGGTGVESQGAGLNAAYGDDAAPLGNAARAEDGDLGDPVLSDCDIDGIAFVDRQRLVIDLDLRIESDRAAEVTLVLRNPDAVVLGELQRRGRLIFPVRGAHHLVIGVVHAIHSSSVVSMATVSMATSRPWPQRGRA